MRAHAHHSKRRNRGKSISKQAKGRQTNKSTMPSQQGHIHDSTCLRKAPLFKWYFHLNYSKTSMHPLFQLSGKNIKLSTPTTTTITLPRSTTLIHRFMEVITLRPYQLSDIDDFMEWACDDEVASWSRLSHLSTKEDALAYLQQVAMPHPWYQAICLDGRPVGFILFDQPQEEYSKCRGLIGYALGRKYWGRRIMTMTVKMAVERLFEEVPGLERVEAVVRLDNEASHRVLEKVGFLKEGVLRKYVVINGGDRTRKGGTGRKLPSLKDGIREGGRTGGGLIILGLSLCKFILNKAFFGQECRRFLLATTKALRGCNKASLDLVREKQE
ncbi:hypothetical protein Ancab_004005 [Ancistrocladus abbreviatus]